MTGKALWWKETVPLDGTVKRWKHTRPKGSSWVSRLTWFSQDNSPLQEGGKMTRGTFRFPGKLTSWLLSLWHSVLTAHTSVSGKWLVSRHPSCVYQYQRKKNQLKPRKCPRLISTHVFLNASVCASFIFRIKNSLSRCFRRPCFARTSLHSVMLGATSPPCRLSLRTKGCTPSPGTSYEQSYPSPPCTVKKKNVSPEER